MTMRRGEKVQIILNAECGEKVEARYLGAGKFCKAYLFQGNVYLWCAHDPGKEALSKMGPMLHVPQVKRIPQAEHPRVDKIVYAMPYYHPLTASNVEAWRIGKLLRQARDNTTSNYLNQHRWDYSGRSMWAIYGSTIARDTIIEVDGCIPATATDALLAMLNKAESMFGASITMEFAAVNLSVDDDGQIVFRDVLFDTTLI